MDFNEKQILPPKNWETFEDLCLELFRRAWPAATAQKNGRRGQPQHGTDIWGTPLSAGGKYHGVQCKGKDAGYGAELTADEIRHEAEKAKKFTPKLVHWIIATTAAKDGALEQLAREISVEHQAQGLFSVQVLGWGDIQTLLANHLDVTERFYPDQAPHIRQTLKRLEAHFELEGGQGALESAINIGRRAAGEDLAKAVRRADLASVIELGIQRVREGERESVERAAFVASLRGGSNLVLEGEPGAGKSTTLLELGGSILSATADLIPIYLPLPELVAGRKSILDEVAGRASFKPVPHGALRQLASAGQIVLLCDGWNEISAEQRTIARTELEKHIRDFPASSVLIATRALSPIPFGASQRYVLAPLTIPQQEAILVGRLGTKGADLLVQARRIPGLRDALQVPLYISALATIGAGPGLPRTKEEVVRRFIESHTQEAGHRDALANVLRGRHDEYLKSLAVRLERSGTVAIVDPELRPVLAAVSRRLHDDGQISAIPEPTEVIDVLVSHHVLIERDGGDKLYSFQHQQFQEWYASFWVEEILAACAGGPGDARAERDAILNAQTWEEAVLFAVERLSRRDKAGVQAVANAILRTLGIDPMMAAEMIQRSAVEVWDSIAQTVNAFASAWLATEQAHRAVAFMVATGRPEFADVVWGVLEGGSGYDHVDFRWGRFSPAVLGQNWKERLARLPEQRRRAVLWDIASEGAEGIAFVTEALKQEPSAEISVSALEVAEYRATDTEFAKMLDAASANVWERLASRRRLEDFPAAFRDRLAAEKRKLAGSLPGDIERMRLLAELGETPQDAEIEQTIESVLSAKFDDFHAEQRVLEGVAAAHPAALSRAIINRLTGGGQVSYAARSFARASEVEDEAVLRQMAVDAFENDRRGGESAARLLTAKSARILIDEMLGLGRQLRAAQGRAQEPLRVQYQARAETLHLVPLSELLPTILATPAMEPETVADLAELMFRWRDEDGTSRPLPIEEPLASDLIAQVRRWVTLMLGHADVRRHHLCELATAIGSIGRPELLPCIKLLLEKDLSLWRGQREAAAKARLEGQVVRGSEAATSYVEMYRQAFDAFGGEEARDILLGLLDEPDFSSQAGFSLIRFGGGTRQDKHETLGRPKYEMIEKARAVRAKGAAEESPVAKALLDRADRLAAAGDPASVAMATRFATAAAQMQYGRRLGSLRAVLDAPGSMRGRLGLLRSLLFSGEEIRAEWVRAGLDETLEALAKEMDGNRDNWWQIREWLELFAFTDSPQELIARLPALPARYKRSYQFRDLAHVAGFAGANAIGLLDGLAAQSPDLVKDYEWLRAFERVGTEAAGAYLIDAAFDPSKVAGMRGEYFTAKGVYGSLLRRHPALVSKLLGRLKGPHDKRSRELVARFIGDAIDEGGVLELIQIVSSREDPIASGLAEAVSELATAKRHLEENASAYVREAASMGSLRERLMEIHLGGGDAAGVAADLLTLIERERDAYGRPPEEPRHPLLGSGIPWPASANVAWDALRAREGA